METHVAPRWTEPPPPLLSPCPPEFDLAAMDDMSKYDDEFAAEGEDSDDEALPDLEKTK